MNKERRAEIGKLQKQIEQFDRVGTPTEPRDGLRVLINDKYAALKEEFENKWAELKSLCDELVGEADDIRGQIEELKDAEQEAFDAMPESLQQSERGQASESAVNALDEAYTAISEIADWELPDLEFPDLDEMLNNVDDATSHLEEATSE